MDIYTFFHYDQFTLNERLNKLASQGNYEVVSVQYIPNKDADYDKYFVVLQKRKPE